MGCTVCEGININFKQYLINLDRHYVFLTIMGLSPSLVAIRFWQEHSSAASRYQVCPLWVSAVIY